MTRGMKKEKTTKRSKSQFFEARSASKLEKEGCTVEERGRGSGFFLGRRMGLVCGCGRQRAVGAEGGRGG